MLLGISYKVGAWPLKYLGLPLAVGGCPKAIPFWDPVVENESKKLACWKRLYISMGGRIILIKVALACIHVY